MSMKRLNAISDDDTESLKAARARNIADAVKVMQTADHFVLVAVENDHIEYLGLGEKSILLDILKEARERMERNLI